MRYFQLKHLKALKRGIISVGKHCNVCGQQHLSTAPRNSPISNPPISNCEGFIDPQGQDLGYDVLVVGGGHAGCEAAAAAARMGRNTLLLTHKIATIGEMSCNPSFGGVGKGHLMREVDALDGLCARICDVSGTHYKVINKSKGPAVWGPRAQIDRGLYKRFMQDAILSQPNLTVLQAPVEDLFLEEAPQGDSAVCKYVCRGVVLESGDVVHSRTVVITTGTFLRGCINIGLSVRPAGRVGDEPAVGLARSLETAGFRMGRLKTGTPPRLDKNTIDFSRCSVHKADNPPEPFSYLNQSVTIQGRAQLDCHMTHVGPEIEKHVHDSLHLNRHVHEEVGGPRFCPSLESKVLRFPGRSHQVWLEPEGFDSDLIYPNGLGCTMPEEYQQKIISTIPGLEDSKIVTPGYGVEYDFIDPRQLRPTLETFPIANLFLAGQINGTTGYEEAAAQGVIAGINAGLVGRDREPFIVDRTEGYIGVLIDDLTTHGTNEPYRMFPSRAEFRLSQRADNADVRLTKKGYNTGCVSEERYTSVQTMTDALQEGLALLSSIHLGRGQWDKLLGKEWSPDKVKKRSGLEVLQGTDIDELIQALPRELGYLNDNPVLKTRLQIEGRYKVEVEKQQEEIEEVRRDEKLTLPQDIDYMSIPQSRCLPPDVRMKLAESRPHTIGAASRIPGMTPAALVHLLKYVKVRHGAQIFSQVP